VKLAPGRRIAHGTALYRWLMAGARGQDDLEWARRRGAYADHPDDRQPRDRRRPPAGPASQTYQGGGFELGLSVAIGLAGVVAGIVALVIGEVQGLFLLGVGCLVMFTGIWAPHRVTLDDSGVVLRAVVRQVRIPWDELESVAPPWWDVRHQALRWGRSRGLAVVSTQSFPELHRLLVEIERRAPRAYVSS
jgi:hypothetical protein